MKRCAFRAVEVKLGETFEVRISGRICPVRIDSLVSSGIWMGTNRSSGKEVCVALVDLLRRAPAVSPGVYQDRAMAAAGDRI